MHLTATDGRIHSQNVVIRQVSHSPAVQEGTLLAFFALTVSKPTDTLQLNVCYHIFKINSDCEDGEVRLVGGASDSEGTLELCDGHLWGLVGESGWSLVDAQVVCRQLGFPIDGNGVKLFLKSEHGC